MQALVLIESETCIPKFFVHKILWLSNATFVLIKVSKGKCSSHCFRFTTRSNCHPSSSSCACPWHSVGFGRCCGLALWGWSCHHQWNGGRRGHTHGRDCPCGRCAECRPPSEIALEVLSDSWGSLGGSRWGFNCVGVWAFFCLLMI